MVNIQKENVLCNRDDNKEQFISMDGVKKHRVPCKCTKNRIFKRKKFTVNFVFEIYSFEFNIILDLPRKLYLNKFVTFQ